MPSTLTITQQPAPFSWSKNPVEFKLMYLGQITGDLVLQFDVYMADNTNPAGQSSVYSGTVRFNNAGFTSVDISRILDANLDYFIAQPWDTTVSTDVVLNYPNQCRFYKVQFAAVYTGSAATTLDGTATSTTKFVAKGGIQIEQFERDAVYNFFWAGTQRFLNYHNNDVFFASQGYLLPAFIANQDWLADEYQHQLFLQVLYYKNDGTQHFQSINLGVLKKGGYYVVPVTLFTQPNAYKLTYALYTGGDVLASDLITVYIDQRRFNFTKFFAYINSLGGTEWQALPFNQVAATNVNSNVFSRFNNAAPAKYNMVIDTQNFQNNFTEQLLETMDSGELSYKNLDHLRQMVLSPAVFELMTAGHIQPLLKYVPATITANAQGSLSAPGNTPQSQQPILDNTNPGMGLPLRVQVARAFNNFSYTPDDSGVRQAIDNTVIAGIGTPIAGYFYATLNPTLVGNAFINWNVNRAFVDFGDDFSAETGNPASHAYTDTALKLVTVGYVYGQPITSLTITSANCIALTNLPQSITALNISGQPMAEYPVLPLGLISLDARYCLFNVTPAIIPNTLTTLKLKGNQIVSLGTYALHATITYLDLSDNKLGVGDVTNLLLGFNAWGIHNGTLLLDGQTPAAHPSAAGLSAKAALIAKGWTVNTD